MSGYQETSGLAYDSIQDKINKKQKMVLEVIMDSPFSSGGMTNQEIADYLELPINTITPRTNELVKKGWVREGGWKIGKSGRKAIVWEYVKE